MSDRGIPQPSVSEATQPPALEAWGPLPGLDPVQEYRVLAQELQACFPKASPQQLDCMIVHEMLSYGGHSRAVVMQAMLQASLSLTAQTQQEAQQYVQDLLTQALEHEVSDKAILGWEG